jgi:small subunit ribosomal protein S8
MSTVSTDPIADMLSRIRNAIAVRKSEVSLPHSKVKESVAKILQESKFIDGVSIENAPVGKTLKIVINKPESNPRITEIQRMSKPGRRYYSGADKIPTVKRGRGIVIVSTSKGVMTGDQAKKQGVGGELICKVY